jgi:hypothetical protein
LINEDPINRLVVSTLGSGSALPRDISIEGELSIMRQSPAIAADSAPFRTEQIADQLAVQMWAETVLADYLATAQSNRALRVPRTVTRLDSLLASLRPVAAARVELARLEGGRLLDGFEVWSARQRAVLTRLVAL